MESYILKNLVKEYQFCERKWRFDMALVKEKIAIEQEGGIYSNGRHVRGNGYINDMEKYNTATILGWKVLRYTPQQIRQYKFLTDIAKILPGMK